MSILHTRQRHVLQDYTNLTTGDEGWIAWLNAPREALCAVLWQRQEPVPLQYRLIISKAVPCSVWSELRKMHHLTDKGQCRVEIFRLKAWLPYQLAS